MASTAIDAQGSVFAINTGSEGSPVWTSIANMNSYTGLDGESSEIDVTDLSSAAKEFRLGLKDNGGFTVEYNVDYADEGQNALRSSGSAVKQFKLTLPNADATEVSFDGLVKNADSISGAVDSVLTGSANIKITGAVDIQ